MRSSIALSSIEKSAMEIGDRPPTSRRGDKQLVSINHTRSRSQTPFLHPNSYALRLPRKAIRGSLHITTCRRDNRPTFGHASKIFSCPNEAFCVRGRPFAYFLFLCLALFSYIYFNASCFCWRSFFIVEIKWNISACWLLRDFRQGPRWINIYVCFNMAWHLFYVRLKC